MKITPTAKAPSTFTEPCGRCGGKGHYHTKLGTPGQDPRELGGNANIEWQPPTGPHPCGACKTTGQRKQKPTITGSYRIEDKPEPQFKGQITRD